MSEHPSVDHEFAGSRQPVGYLLMRVHRALRATIDDTLRPHGFTMPQVAVLFALGREVRTVDRRARTLGVRDAAGDG